MCDTSVTSKVASHPNEWIRTATSLIQQSRWILIGKISLGALTFLSGILLARILDIASLGQYRLGLALAKGSTTFSVFGLDRGLIRFLPVVPPTEAKRMVIRATGLSLVLSFGIGLTLFWHAPTIADGLFHSPQMAGVIRLFSIYVPLFSIFSLASGATTGLKRADIGSNIGNVLVPTTFLALLFYIYWEGLSLASCIHARLLAATLGGATLVAVLFSLFPKATSGRLSVGWKEFLSFSSPVLLIGVIYYFLNQMDVLMLGYFLSDSHVGLYSVAARVALLVFFAGEILLPLLGPPFAELSHLKDWETINTLFSTATKWLFYSGLAMFGLLLPIRTEILQLFGEQYAAGHAVVIILGFAHVTNLLTGPTGKLLVMSGRQNWELFNTVGIISLNFLLNILLIPRFGPIGAAIATAASIVIVNLVKLVQVNYAYGIQPYHRHFVVGLLCAVSASGSCTLLRPVLIGWGLSGIWLLVISCAIFTVVFVPTVLRFGIDDEDRALLQLVWER